MTSNAISAICMVALLAAKGGMCMRPTVGVIEQVVTPERFGSEGAVCQTIHSDALPTEVAEAANNVEFWNAVAMQAVRTDFSGGLPPRKTNNPAPENPGPTFTSRALAIIHGAMFDAHNYVTKVDETYLPVSNAYPGLADSAGLTDAEREAVAGYAIGEAAFTTLSALYPSQLAYFVEQLYEFYDGSISGTAAVRLGRSVGAAVGVNWIVSRLFDGSEVSAAKDAAYVAPAAGPYVHQPDPLNPGQGYLGTAWGAVRPFGYVDTECMRAQVTPLPDPLTTGVYSGDFQEVAANGTFNATSNLGPLTETGLFWAYDGAKNIGVPMVLYNQIALAIARGVYKTPGSFTDKAAARLFAIVNIAMADAGIQAWFEKYRWNFWRPVVGVRAGSGTSPDDPNHTEGIPDWKPVGSPRSNTLDPTFTPNFPAYPSGHATFGTAMFTAVSKELGICLDSTFTLTSDELNGVTFDSFGTRPMAPRTMSLQEGIIGNVESRVYLGVHWRADGTQGAVAGKDIGLAVASSFPKRAGAHASV